MRKTDKKKKRLSLKTALFKGAYVHNTVLTCLAGICPIAAVCVSAKNALWLSLIFSFVLIMCEVSASLFLKRFSRWVRVCLYALVSSAALILPMFAMDDKTVSSFGVYLPLLCVSGVIVIRCEKFAVRTSVYNSFIDSVASSVGFSGVAIIVGIVRELISTGKILGIDTSAPTIPAIAMPFGGFLILGFATAVHKWSVIKFHPNEIVDTFNMSGAEEKPVFKDPGLGAKKAREYTKKLSEEKEEYEKIRPRYSIEDIEIENDKSTEETP